VIIQGRFIGDSPYFPIHLRSEHFQGLVWLLADTEASRTTLLDRDVRLLGIPATALEPASVPLVGIGGSVRSFLARDEYHDEGHGNFVVDVIKGYCMEEHLQDEMREAVKTRTDIMWLQNESIYQTYVRLYLAPDVIRQIEGRLE